jgi:catechol 2,3-dioxygenase-like lactoylglutathione lyase family enzyme
VRIDHVIVATADLDAAAARLAREHGLRACGGGRHEGLGTHNRIVPLGSGYLEILAVADAEEAARSALGRALAAGISQAREGLMGWAVTVDDVVPVAERLDTPVSTILRQGLSARLTGVSEAIASPFLPFFIARDPGIEDPGASGGAGGIEWIEVAGDADRLDAWLGGARLPVRVVEGTPAIRAVAISGQILR